MILIADSGSTKTDWCIVGRNTKPQSFQTPGMNPNFASPAQYTSMSNSLLKRCDPSTISNVYFYGSGCGTECGCSNIYVELARIFPDASISIMTDMLGACRCVCGDKDGLVAILGTGSNSCLYKNRHIEHNIPALGYILCDEGSGNHIGRKLLRAYLSGRLPKELETCFYRNYPHKIEFFLEHLYQQPFPNRFLASFSVFAYKHKKHPYMQQLLHQVFTDFFTEQITQYQHYSSQTLSIVGSVGYFFSDEIRLAAQPFFVQIGSIVQSPMEGLIQYHVVDTNEL